MREQDVVFCVFAEREPWWIQTSMRFRVVSQPEVVVASRPAQYVLEFSFRTPSRSSLNFERNPAFILTLKRYVPKS